MSAVRLTRREAAKLGLKIIPTHPRRAKEPEPLLCDSYRVTTEVVTVKLPWPPSVNDYYVRTHFGGLAIGARGKEYRKTVTREWSRQAGRVTFEGRLAVRLECVFPDERERDLDNIEKALFDSLQHAGAFRKDSQIKLKTSEQDRTQAPGWVTVTIGPKPGVAVQRGLFGNEW